ncbi:MAG: YlxM family DNA-binding protein [Bacilli bacterium]
MDKRIRLNDLYDYYKELFTEKQQEYFEDYYHNNLSLSEISENNNVSRNAVHNQIKIVEARLEELESILKLLERKEKVLDILSKEISEEALEKIEDLL